MDTDFYHVEMYRLMNDPDVIYAATRDWCSTARARSALLGGDPFRPVMRWVPCTICDRSRFREAKFPRHMCPLCTTELKRRYYRSIMERIQYNCHRRVFQETVLPQVVEFGWRPDRLDATQWYSETTRRSFWRA
jgi:hypothetical protein